MSPLKKLGAVAAAVAATAVVLTPVANASSPGRITVCAEGGHDAWARFPARGGWTTNIVPSGHCYGWDTGHTGPERVDVFSSGGGEIGAFTYDGRQGATVVVSGWHFYIA